MSKVQPVIRCVIVDDEPMGLRVLQTHALKVPNLLVLAAFVSATEALAYLQTQPVDLLLLDVQMPDLPGTELARLVQQPVHIVFTTAYAQYAVEGFDLAAVDYLLKPITLSRFMQACQRVSDRMARQTAGAGQLPPYLFVKTGYDWARIDLAALLYIEADDNYLTFHETSRRTLSRMTLGEILGRLPPETFVRIHKSFVVALDKIDTVERHQVLIGGRRLPLSAGFRDGLLKRFSQP